jgi:Ca2+-binding RTX toxin-like protein
MRLFHHKSQSSRFALGRRFAPCVETLEDRTLPAVDPLSAQFQTAAGLLTLHGTSAAHLASVSLTPGGYVELAVAGQQFSSNPAATNYDPALAGATGQSLHAIQLDGNAGADHLVVGNWSVAGGLSLQTDGLLDIQGRVSAGGLVQLSGHAVQLSGQVSGGSVSVTADNVVQSGLLRSSAAVRVGFTGSYIATVAAQTSAGLVVIDGGSTGNLFTSGHYQGTEVDLFGQQVHLIGANVSASGWSGGGLVRVGGDSPSDIAQHGGLTAGISFAATTTVDASTTLSADAVGAGNGGHIVVWSQQSTTFGGTLSAHGAGLGHGGLLEVSSGGLLTYAGHASAAGGTLLLDPKNIVISNSAGLPQFTLLNPQPDPQDTFGSSVTALANGNVVVTDPNSGIAALNAGAVFLYNGQTGALISTLTGDSSGDQVGSGGVTALTNGNFVVSSPQWNNVGAATWVSGSTPSNFAVSAANSLVGATAGDQVSIGDQLPGSSGIIALTNGNYVVDSPFWQASGNLVGAVTWGNGWVGTSGAVSASNSLVGSTSFDTVGSQGVTALTNGNYVVSSPSWQIGGVQVGAATWANGLGGTVGPVSSSNSLVGEVNQGGIATGGTVALTDGNYVVVSPAWQDAGGNALGAVTWGNGSSGTVDQVSAGNSFVGATGFDFVGSGGVTALPGGNYVVSSPGWQSIAGTYVGAVTWVAGGGSSAGVVSAANSLTGATNGDGVGSGGVTVLTNGNYVVCSPNWQDGTGATVGAVTWSASNGSTTGPVTAANSLVGSTAGDSVGFGNGNPGSGVIALAGGAYVVVSPSWQSVNGVVGAVTWGAGNGTTVGTVSATNSLIGSTNTDQVGAGGVTALPGGNYVVNSPYWHHSGADVGAVTLGAANGSTVGTVTTANSLTGSVNGDQVGSGGVIVVSGGSYVVSSPRWQNSVGAATWVNGTTGATLDGAATVDAANSLVGPGSNYLLSQVVGVQGGGSIVASYTNNGGLVIVAPLSPSVGFATAATQTVSLSPTFLAATLDTGTAVVLQASNNITISSPIVVNNPSGPGGNLTLQAGQSILITANIDTGNGNLTMIANDTAADGVVDSQRDPTKAAGITMTAGTSINAGTGNVVITLSTGAGNTGFASDDITLGNITAHNITLSNNGPGDTSIGGTNVGGGVDMASVTATGNLIIQSTGDISQTGTLNVAGHATLGAAGLIVLNNAANTFGSTVAYSAPGGEVEIAATGTLSLSSTSAAATITASASGLLIAADELAVSGAASFTGGSISLTSPLNAFQGTVSLSSTGSIAIVNSTALTVGNLTLGANATLSAPAGLTFAGNLDVGNHTLALTTTGPARLSGSTNLAGGTISDASGLTIGAGGTLSGSGTLQAGSGAAGVLAQVGATLAPGTGGLTVNGDLTLSSASVFSVQLQSATQYSQLTATGAINLSNATLQVALGYTPSINDRLQVITNNGGHSVTGTFLQGGSTSANSIALTINYAGGTGANNVVIRLTTPPPPTANTDLAAVLENSAPNTVNVLANDVGTALGVTSFTPAAHGTVAITNNGAALTYQPSTNFFGVDTFTYTITDIAGQTATATVVVIVSEVAVPPVASVPAGQQFVVNKSLAIPGITVSDPNGHNPTVTATLAVQSGTLTLGSTVGLTSVQGNGTSTLVVTGLADFVNYNLSTLSYLSKQYSAQADTLSVTVTDTGGQGTNSISLTPARNIVMAVAAPLPPIHPAVVIAKQDLIVQGTTGTDTITVAPGTTANSYVVTLNGTPKTVTGITGQIVVFDLNGNNNTISLSSTVRTPAQITVGDGNNTVIGGAGNDTITAGIGSNRIDGGLGVNTLIESGDVDFTLVGGTTLKNGTLTKGAAQDTLVLAHIQQVQLTLTGPDDHTIDGTAFAGPETLIGAAGNDTLLAGSGKDSLVGGTGNDLLVGGKGGGSLVGGNGNDTIVASSIASNTIDGGGGTNTLVESGNNDFILVGGTPIKNGTLTKGAFKDTLVLDHIQQVQLTLTGPANHTINAIAFSGPETLVGAAGNDTLLAGSGNNVLVGGTGKDKLVAGPGSNLLIAGSGASSLIGGSGQDLLIGGTTSFNNNMTALAAIMAEWTSADDYATKIARLTGSQGGGANGSTVLTNATVQNSGKASTLTGGAGVDWFWKSALDVVTDVNNGGTETVTAIP